MYSHVIFTAITLSIFTTLVTSFGKPHLVNPHKRRLTNLIEGCRYRIIPKVLGAATDGEIGITDGSDKNSNSSISGTSKRLQKQYSPRLQGRIIQLLSSYAWIIVELSLSEEYDDLTRRWLRDYRQRVGDTELYESIQSGAFLLTSKGRLETINAVNGLQAEIPIDKVKLAKKFRSALKSLSDTLAADSLPLIGTENSEAIRFATIWSQAGERVALACRKSSNPANSMSTHFSEITDTDGFMAVGGSNRPPLTSEEKMEWVRSNLSRDFSTMVTELAIESLREGLIQDSRMAALKYLDDFMDEVNRSGRGVGERDRDVYEAILAVHFGEKVAETTARAAVARSQSMGSTSVFGGSSGDSSIEGWQGDGSGRGGGGEGGDGLVSSRELLEKLFLRGLVVSKLLSGPWTGLPIADSDCENCKLALDSNGLPSVDDLAESAMESFSHTSSRGRGSKRSSAESIPNDNDNDNDDIKIDSESKVGVFDALELAHQVANGRIALRDLAEGQLAAAAAAVRSMEGDTKDIVPLEVRDRRASLTIGVDPEKAESPDIRSDNDSGNGFDVVVIEERKGSPSPPREGLLDLDLGVPMPREYAVKKRMKGNEDGEGERGSSDGDEDDANQLSQSGLRSWGRIRHSPINAEARALDEIRGFMDGDGDDDDDNDDDDDDSTVFNISPLGFPMRKPDQRSAQSKGLSQSPARPSPRDDPRNNRGIRKSPSLEVTSLNNPVDSPSFRIEIGEGNRNGTDWRGFRQYWKGFRDASNSSSEGNSGSNGDDDSMADISVGPTTVNLSPDEFDQYSAGDGDTEDLGNGIRRRAGWRLSGDAGAGIGGGDQDSYGSAKTESSGARKIAATAVMEPPSRDPPPPRDDERNLGNEEWEDGRDFVDYREVPHEDITFFERLLEDSTLWLRIVGIKDEEEPFTYTIESLYDADSEEMVGISVPGNKATQEDSLNSLRNDTQSRIDNRWSQRRVKFQRYACLEATAEWNRKLYVKRWVRYEDAMKLIERIEEGAQMSQAQPSEDDDDSASTDDFPFYGGSVTMM